MAIVIRYFSTASAGDGDGTTWANRAALFSSGDWSSVIAGFDFSGTDSLECRIGPGTYAMGQSLGVGIFTNAPTRNNMLHLLGADSSGNALPQPTSWTSAQPTWDLTNVPVIEFSGGQNVNLHQSMHIMLHYNYTGTFAGTYLGQGRFGYCVATSTASGTNTNCFGTAVSCFSCVADLSGSDGYSAGFRFSATTFNYNCRAVGNSTATTGVRAGFLGVANFIWQLSRCTAIDNAGNGFEHSTGTTCLMIMHRCMAINNEGSGFEGKSTTITLTYADQLLDDCVATGNGVNGVKVATSPIYISGGRYRDNTSGDFDGRGNTSLLGDVITTAGTDAAEYVNAAGGDFRIKATSALWGTGIGGGDEIPTAAAIATAVWAREGRTLTS